MNNDWKEFLLSNGADQDAYGRFRFNDESTDNKKAITTDSICDISHFSTLVVAGDDASFFMQGQFTNDVTLADKDSSQLNAFCNNKGRMMANFRLFEHENNYFLNLKSDLVDLSIKHLQAYILRAHVFIQDVSDQLVHLSVSGKNATELLSPFIDDIDDKIDNISHNKNYAAIRVAGPIPRYEIFCSNEHAQALWKKISQQAEVVNSASWDYLNIQAGIPFIDATNSEAFVPQMANMDLINGVSFTKGCYTGQEIVARMHYLGKLKKRCYRIHIDTETKPESGDKLFAKDAKAGQNTGAIIQAEKNPESGYDALAVIQIADSKSSLFLNDADGPRVTVKDLPYTFDSEQS